MAMGRRELLLGAAAAGLAGPASARAAASQHIAGPPEAPTASAAAPSRTQRIAAAAAQHKQRLDFANGAFAGPAWDYLLARGREAQVFMLGEEHGIAENPKLAAALFRALVPAGYARVAVEISDAMAAEVDRALTAGGFAGLRRMIEDETSRVAFFGLREEAEWLAAARAALPGGRPFLWGVDYEVGGDRHLIAMLKGKRKGAAAERALAALEAASNASWAQYHQTHNPQYIYSFSGDPALVRALRAAWPAADAQARLILDTLEETFEINHLWVAGNGYGSNLRRAALMRASFLRHWHAEPAAARPRLFMKFGASHVMRGLTPTGVFDLGTLVPELAGLENRKTFQLLVLAGATSETGNLDPQTFRYVPGHREQYQEGMEPFTGQAEGFTLFETAPLRGLARSGDRTLHPELVRAIHGFDAILVMAGSTPSHDLLG
jgi:hypothetical protein